jgi:hypothetical protein
MLCVFTEQSAMEKLSFVLRRPSTGKPTNRHFNTQPKMIAPLTLNSSHSISPALPAELPTLTSSTLSCHNSSCMNINIIHRSSSLDQYLSSSSASSLISSQNIQYWSFGDQSSADLVTCQGSPGVLPLASFNHISREVLDLEKSVKFYSLILGFQEIPRPSLDCKGCWLFGYGVRSPTPTPFHTSSLILFQCSSDCD